MNAFCEILSTTYWQKGCVLPLDLVGGLTYFLVSTLFGKDFQFDLNFSNGLVQSPTSLGILTTSSSPTAH